VLSPKLIASGPSPGICPSPGIADSTNEGPQLEKAEDFDKWYLNVVQVLEDYDLKDLIDANFPRPAKKHHQAEDWLRMSQDLKSGWPPVSRRNSTGISLS